MVKKNNIYFILTLIAVLIYIGNAKDAVMLKWHKKDENHFKLLY